jgi:predicted membrane-bound spermidine synthase
MRTRKEIELLIMVVGRHRFAKFHLLLLFLLTVRYSPALHLSLFRHHLFIIQIGMIRIK